MSMQSISIFFFFFAESLHSMCHCACLCFSLLCIKYMASYKSSTISMITGLLSYGFSDFSTRWRQRSVTQKSTTGESLFIIVINDIIQAMRNRERVKMKWVKTYSEKQKNIVPICIETTFQLMAFLKKIF